MLRITAEKRPLCDGLRRRDVLRVGMAGLFGLGLTLPRLLQGADARTGAGKVDDPVRA